MINRTASQHVSNLCHGILFLDTNTPEPELDGQKRTDGGIRVLNRFDFHK